MLEQPSNPKHCSFCSFISPQRKEMLLLLLRRLQKELSTFSKKYGPENCENEGSGFRQLLRITFPTDPPKPEPDCDHKRFYHSFLRKLKCTEEIFNFVCEKLAYQLAEKNYHLELLAVQVKNAAQRIAEGKVGRPGEQRRDEKRERRELDEGEEQQPSNTDLRGVGKVTQQANVATGTQLQNGSMTFLPLHRSDYALSDSSHPYLNNYGYYLSYPLFFSPNN